MLKFWSALVRRPLGWKWVCPEAGFESDGVRDPGVRGDSGGGVAPRIGELPRKKRGRPAGEELGFPAGLR